MVSFQAGNKMAKTVPVTMYDSATPDNIPTSAQVVAGYIDGDFAWPADAWDRWPGADRVLITVSGSLTGNVADVENGDMTPDQARGWIEAKQAAHHRGCTVYCNRASLRSVWAACRGHAYYIWVADWTGSPHEIANTIATQYQNNGDQYDLTMIYSQQWLNAVVAANTPWPVK